MRANPPTPDHQSPGGLPAPDTAATESPAPGDPVHRRKVEKSVSWSGRERLRFLWYRLRLQLSEINYANRRLLEVQAPWTADPQWHTKADLSLPRPCVSDDYPSR